MWSTRGRRILPLALIVLGAALRLDVFLAGRPLSLDEAAMSRNLIARSWTGILGPLDFAQVAPPAFLLVEKGVASLLGTGESALRLFPLLCGIGSVWLSWAVSRRILSFGPAVVALALVAVNNLFIDYSVNLKQYSTDIAATLLVLLVAMEFLGSTPTRKRSLWLGAAGAATAAFSFTAVFALSGAAATSAMVALRTREQSARQARLIAAVMWAIGAALATFLGHVNLTPNDAAYMKWFWGAGFMPLPPASLHDALWLWGRLRTIFSFTAQYRASIGWLALVVLGTWSLVRRGRADAASILLIPLLLVIAASAARLYPFEPGRLQLFLLPALLILVAEGTGWCWRLSTGRARWLFAVPGALVLALAVQSAWVGFKEQDREGVRPVVEYVRSNWRPGDRMYVYYGTGQQFLYYAPRYDFTIDDYTVGTCSRGSGRPYLRELDRFRGHARVWVLLSRYEMEPGVLLSYLDAIGTPVDAAFVKESTSDAGYWGSPFVYLYDLTDSPRSASVSAELFPLPEALSQSESYPWACYGVFSPIGGGPSR